jgi:tRNA threonylcarbamoyladenosine biosynthesis protein TsaB
VILTIRTDKPESEIGLFDGQEKIAYKTWQAHRQLAETVHSKIKELLADQHKNLEDITGIVVYKGPGSFTGLRIGMSVANALAYSLDAPITAGAGNEWLADGITSLAQNPSKVPVTPEYGAAVRTTRPRK